MSNKDIVQRLLEWFARNARPLPWRRTRDPYAIWVSEIMLQQTQVKTVLPYWERWMRALPNLTALAKAKPQTLHKLWEGLGYYTRVRNLQRAARLIVEQHHGRFPRDFAALLALPGIGRYTAGAVCSIAFDQPQAILDGNVIRVLTRLRGIVGDPRERKTNARLWELAEELVLQAAKTTTRLNTSPHGSRITQHATRNTQHASRPCSQFNQSLMELGALVCTPRQPRCGVCPIAKDCVAYRQGRVHELPRLSRRVRATPRRFVAFVAQKRGLLLVRQRPAGGVNAHLWEFPNLELSPDDSDLRSAAYRALGVRPRTLEPLATIKHSITRYRITLEAYQVTGREAARIPADIAGRWLARGQLKRLAFTSAHKQILARLVITQPKRRRSPLIKEPCA
jgi:A/G-specific adenine glycosylase